MLQKNEIKGIIINKIDVSVFSDIFFKTILENIIEIKKGGKGQN